jgi:hypothetical protein
LDVSIDSTLVTIHISPYFLRLNLPGPVVNPEESPDPAEDAPADAHYDASSGWLRIALRKEQRGQHFPDLDLLPMLLAPPQATRPPVIEVLDAGDGGNGDAGFELASGMDGLNLDEERREILKGALPDLPLATRETRPTRSQPRRTTGACPSPSRSRCTPRCASRTASSTRTLATFCTRCTRRTRSSLLSSRTAAGRRRWRHWIGRSGGGAGSCGRSRSGIQSTICK